MTWLTTSKGLNCFRQFSRLRQCSFHFNEQHGPSDCQFPVCVDKRVCGLRRFSPVLWKLPAVEPHCQNIVDHSEFNWHFSSWEVLHDLNSKINRNKSVNSITCLTFETGWRPAASLNSFVQFSWSCLKSAASRADCDIDLYSSSADLNPTVRSLDMGLFGRRRSTVFFCFVSRDELIATWTRKRSSNLNN